MNIACHKFVIVMSSLPYISVGPQISYSVVVRYRHCMYVRKLLQGVYVEFVTTQKKFAKLMHVVYLYTVCVYVHLLLVCRAPGLRVCGESVNPVIHLQLTCPSSSRDTDDELLECVARECIDSGVAVVVAKYLKEELKLPPARYICI